MVQLYGVLCIVYTSTDVIAVIEKYSKFSGYKLNLDKSQALYMHAPSEAISKSLSSSTFWISVFGN